MWFILTGVPPLMYPIESEVHFALRARFEGGSREPIPPSEDPLDKEWRVAQATSPSTAIITLKVEPWVPAEEVKKYYRRVQKELVGNQKPPWERNLHVYKFVKDKRSEEVEDSELWSLWNKESPEKWRYKKRHGFWQAYESARRSIEETTFRRSNVQRPNT